MIRATIYLHDGVYQGYEIKGHADYAPHGQDIVCAAVSLLATACANSLELQLGKSESHSHDGQLTCRIGQDLSPEERLKAQAVMKTLEVGLKSVREAYPAHIRLQRLNIKHEI